ncbi:MBL fold metallo-hydrolase [Halococcus sediminicola]|uniref:MBL fold metallo-hydrolase n=1 Tax=Halococcus sediminicola TaxID=1264579 RepID=UPI0006787D7A|nr:MBL fold metallo-hydrolase [Halococcus sediminicola]
MRVTFLGTGAAMPSGRRAQSGLLLESAADTAAESASGQSAREQADGDSLLVDCGSGVLNALARTDVGYEGVSTVLLSHHHLDHVADLLPLMKARWLAGAEHLEIVGPQGTKALLDGLLDVHEYMDGRIDLRVREIGEESFAVAGFDVEGKETRHSMDCLAYRFAHDDGPAFTFSADSEAFEGLATFADGSAVLAHDCSFPDEVDVSNHPTPSQLGETLAESGVEIGRVYLTHLYPHTEGRHEEMLESIGEHYAGDVRFARDGLTVEIE